MGQLVDSTRENTRGLASIAGETPVTLSAKQNIEEWQGEIRDHAARRESDRNILLVIAGILFVVGALFIK